MLTDEIDSTATGLKKRGSRQYGATTMTILPVTKGVFGHMGGRPGIIDLARQLRSHFYSLDP
jgi:hypothetical protein